MIFLKFSCFSEDVKTKKKIRQIWTKFCTFFFFFHHKWIITRALSPKGWYSSCLKTFRMICEDLTKLGKFNKLPEKLGIDGKSSVGQLKVKSGQLSQIIMKNLLWKIQKKHLFYIILWICLQYFVYCCRW